MHIVDVHIVFVFIRFEVLIAEFRKRLLCLVNVKYFI